MGKYRDRGRGLTSAGGLPGEHNPGAKFTDREIELIRELYGTLDAAGRRIGYGRLAKMFEMSKSHVREIIKERRRVAEAVEYR
jgi:hypothetical protein